GRAVRAGVQGGQAAVGRGADVRLAGAVPPAGQGLRGDDGQQRGVRQVGDDPSDGPPARQKARDIAFSTRSEGPRSPVLPAAPFPVIARNCFHEITSMPNRLISAATAGSVKIRRSPSRRLALLVTARSSSSAKPQWMMSWLTPSGSARRAFRQFSTRSSWLSPP